MTVRAKFQVRSIETSCGYNTAQPEVQRVKLSAVSDDANKTWAKYTPSGELSMQIDNPAALEQFKVGQYVFLDISEAPAKEADEASRPAT